MHRLPIEQQILLAAQAIGIAVLCFRLWRTGLHRIYVWFFGYLVVELAQILVPIVIPIGSQMYRNAFTAVEALSVCCYVLVVLELYSIILGGLAGIATWSRRYIKVTLAVAIVASLLALGLEKPPDTVTGYLFSFERAVILSLALFLLLLGTFLVYYPVPLNRNVLVYLTGYAVLFLPRCAITILNNMGYHLNRLWGSLLMGVDVLCLLFWVAGLSRQGETRTVVLGHQWNRADEARLLAQLEAVNDSLLRAGRK